MARKATFAALAVMLVAAATLIQNTAAAVYFVGDTLGWTIPPGGASVYTTWASNHTFAVSDNLVFNFAVGAHDVARVTKDAFDACTSTNPLNLYTVPPVNFTLNSSGDYYFICTFGQHCANGQKLALNVSGASGSPTPSPSPAPPSPSPAPTPTPSTTPPPPPPSTIPTPTPSPAAHSPAPSPSGTTSPPPPPAPGSPPAGSPPPGTTPSDTNTTSPPPPSSAPPKAAAAFGIMFISIAIGVMF